MKCMGKCCPWVIKEKERDIYYHIPQEMELYLIKTRFEPNSKSDNQNTYCMIMSKLKDDSSKTSLQGLHITLDLFYMDLEIHPKNQVSKNWGS